MQEPRKYTAKEAMHWMIDNPDAKMIHCDKFLSNRYFRFDSVNFCFQTSMKQIGWVQIEVPLEQSIDSFYIESEHDAWQESLKKKQEEAGSLGILADRYDPESGTRVVQWEWVQNWIESYVQREIRKALGGL